ncbi:MAG: PorV/PorQ family protein [Elusimicrobia bacterium]|nr:PorV/PorQ family protein [Elusimicrobiota bacterium]
MSRALALRVAALLLAASAASAGFFPSDPFSEAAAGTTGAAFLKLPTGARAEALAGTYVAAAEGSESVFWNPAGLARMAGSGRSDVSFGYNALLESSYAGAVAWARPLASGKSTVGASLLYHSPGAIDAYDRLGNPNGTFTPIDLALAGAYARRFGILCAGVAGKFIRSELAGASGTTFALDFGVIAERVGDMGDGAVDLGASVRNLGPAISVGSVADPLPFALQLGGLWHVNPKMSLLLDGHLEADADPYPSLGGEFTQPFGAASKGQLRFGYNVKRQRGLEGLSGLAAGGGLDLDVFRIDYAWVPFGELGTTHRITTALRF